jgi:DNA invertase Pin-like site-specific DNA recombinase
VRSATLAIARLDRLARNVALVSRLMESGVEFVAADFPQANRLTIHILAAIAEYESKMISERTKAALVHARARGVKLGGDRGKARQTQPIAAAASVAARSARSIARAKDLSPIVCGLRAAGASLRSIADELRRQRIEPPRKGSIWYTSGVARILKLSA